MAITRRKFLLASGVAAGALAVGYVALREDEDPRSVYQKTAKAGEIALNAWVKIDAEGVVSVALPRHEMGQGIHTALAMLVAEELDADWSDIRVEDVPVNAVYANRVLLKSGVPFTDAYHRGEDTISSEFMGWLAGMIGVQATGGSTSVRDAWEPMRLAGAAAKAMLISAAAQKWNVTETSCVAEQGVVRHLGSSRKAGYGELAGIASAMPPPKKPTTKDSADYRLIGKPVPRLDVAEKSTGKAAFGVDMQPEGLVHAAVRNAPVFGGSLKSHDAAAVKDMPGVIRVVSLPGAVAVVADSWWRAKKAVDAIPVEFGAGDHADLDSDKIFALLSEEVAGDGGFNYRDDGDVDSVLSKASGKIEATYKVPYLAHACMEPMNCTARVDVTAGKPSGVEIWMPNQAPFLMKFLAARVADVDIDRVQVHTTYLGGGFGRRAEGDLAEQAVALAMTVPGKAVKVLWSREEDIQHDMYRPAAMSRFEAVLDEQGRPAAWRNRIAGQVPTTSITGRIFPFAAIDMPDNTSSEGSADMPYRVPHFRVDHTPVDLPVPVGFWRSVGHSYNAFFVECFMDELAAEAGKDPYRYRRELLDAHPDYLAVLDKAARAAGWDKALAPGRGRGIALHESFGSVVAQVAEIEMVGEDTIKLDRVVCAVDCGRVINPDTCEAQIESAIIFGLTAAMYGEITLEDGRVEQENFPDYEMIQLAHAPKIEVHLVPSGRPLGGIGEVGTPPIAPALANAIFNATGKRVRELPLSKAGFSL